ncbi:uncharacterized protein I206_101443 [Kwoniella pini CBS 10737]|uniref:Histone-lysine N-methyltransferase ASH1L n=1 Tax=Kwoniella pini CBS 10737 TaxID=1296096 RepID=A0A1B9HWN7_9TREE|nr:uncharacterized protein I206_06586 [Kwoniella pini CBS 10737]OCF47681.1 hypothetical protein I206_06586 [Kwoniella pini CBS 10737]
MAPVKPIDKANKKKRTFFSSKLDIPIPKVIVKEKNKEKPLASTKIVLSALEGLESIHLQRDQPKTRTQAKKVKDEIPAKRVKVYTSKSKSKAQAIITRNSKMKNVNNGIIGKIRPKTIRSVITTTNNVIEQKSNSSIAKKGNTTSSRRHDHQPSKIFGNKRKVSVKSMTKANIITIKSTSSRKIPPVVKLFQTSTSSKLLLKNSKTLKEGSTKPTMKSSESQPRSGPSITNEKAILDSSKKGKESKSLKKEYMLAGFYCQDPNPSSSKQLHNKILAIRSSENKSSKSSAKKPIVIRHTRHNVKSKTSDEGKNQNDKLIIENRPSFPPLPYDHGYELFFKQEHDFVLPYYIMKEKEDGKLIAKKKPTQFTKIRGNIYPERQKVMTDFHAICRCSPESKCADQCINKLMSYLCGKECPAGEECTNKTLTKRKPAAYKVVYTGTRGFGIVVMEDVKEGDFVMDYRGEVISIDTFMDRIQDEYKGSKNFYALAYDQDEVIDAGMKGNDARFINHGCAPNLEVRKYQTAGDGWEEFEVGMWAIKDIKAGEELFYDYNFESFGVAAQSDELRTRCHCGAPNCVGFLGRKAGEKSAKELAAELARNAKIMQGKKASIKKLKHRLAEKAHVQAQIKNTARLGTTVLGLESTPSIVSNTDTITTNSIKTPSELSPSATRNVTIRQPSSSPLSEESNSPVVEGIADGKKRKLENSNVDGGIHKKKARNSEPLTLSNKKIKQSRKSETGPASIPPSTLTVPLVHKKSRKSEPIIALSKSADLKVEMEDKSMNNPRISMDVVREAARMKKAEIVKARKGVPKGWTIVLPGQEPPPRAPQPVVSGRRPPRDRSSLG